MSYLKNLNTNVIISRYIDFKSKQETNLVIQTSLDGTEYLTRFGAPVKSYMLDVWLKAHEKELLYSAFNFLALMEIETDEGVFKGRIKEVGEPEKLPNGFYKMNIILSSTSEVSER